MTRTMSTVVYLIRPMDGVTLRVGDELLPMIEFASNVRLIRCRRREEYAPCAFIEGDGALDLLSRWRPLPMLRVASVSELSGFAKSEPLSMPRIMTLAEAVQRETDNDG